MRKTTNLAAAAAVSLLVGATTTSASPAQGTVHQVTQPNQTILLVQDRGERRDRGERWRGRGGRDWDHRRRGGFNLYIGPGPGFYYGRPGSGGCEWLRRRAINSGSNYWWRRYRQCRGWR